MFKKILLPLDLTDKHLAALNIAVELARPGRGEVILLHVIEVIPGLPREEEQDFYNRLEPLARAHLRKFTNMLADRQIAYRSDVVIGHRVRSTAEFAIQHGIDLIIVTAPRLQADPPTGGWGSLSWKMGLIATCPVLLVK